MPKLAKQKISDKNRSFLINESKKTGEPVAEIVRQMITKAEWDANAEAKAKELEAA